MRRNLFIARTVDGDYVAAINNIGNIPGPGKKLYVVSGCNNHITISRLR